MRIASRRKKSARKPQVRRFRPMVEVLEERCLLSADDYGFDTALQFNDMVVAVGQSFNGTDFDFALARYKLTDGSLDTAFGIGGRVTTDFGGHDGIQSVVVQSDNKIVVGGASTEGANHYFALARYQPDGTLDHGFGVNGKVRLALGSSPFFGIADIAVQANGAIVAFGASAGSGGGALTIVRFTPQGQLDSTFDADGIVFTGFGGGDRANAIVMDSQERIVVVGTGSNDFIMLARYNVNGALDATFGADGKVSTRIRDNDNASDLVIEPDGQIVVGGATFTGFYDSFIARYNNDGSLDAGFGSGGILITSLSGLNDGIEALVLQTDGRILAAGSAGGPGQDFLLARFDTDGNVVNGAITPIAVGTGHDESRGLVTQPGGKVITAGLTTTGGAAGVDFALARYNPDFTLDTSFDGDGIVVTDFGGTRHVPPNAPGFTISTYATIQGPGRLAFDPSGVLYTGRETVENVSLTDFVGQIGIGGSPVTDYGARRIDDPDAVAFDAAGLSGVPGSVLAAGFAPGGGHVTAIRPDQSVAPLFGPDSRLANFTDLEFDQAGRLLLADYDNNHIAISTGGFPTTFVGVPTPRDIAVDSGNHVYVISDDSVVRVYDSAGVFLRSFAVPNMGPFPAIDISSGGAFGTDLYEIDSSGQLRRFDAAGNATVIGTGFERPAGLAFGPDGALYVSEYGNNRILRIGVPPCVDPPANIVSWWAGDGNADDLIGPNDGTLMNGALANATGMIGQAFRFDGVDDFVEIPDDPSLTPRSLTLEAWVNPDSLAPSPTRSGSDLRVIMSKYSATPALSGRSWALTMFDGGRIRFAVYGADSVNEIRAEDTVNPVLGVGEWTHVAGTFDVATQSMRIYVDGVEVLTTAPPEHRLTVDPIFDSPTVVRIGSTDDSPGTTGFWDGLIDEPSLYSRALSAGEIQAIYAAGAAGKCKPTVQEGIDRWYATAGDNRPMPVTWTVNITRADDYHLDLDIENWNTWDLTPNATVRIDGGTPIPFNSVGVAGLGHLSTGVHRLTIDGFDVPNNAVGEEIEFELWRSAFLGFGTLEKELTALFIADHLDVYQDQTFHIAGEPQLLVGADALVDYFAPILHFSAGERYAMPFSVEESLAAAAISRQGRSLIQGSADDHLDLSLLSTGNWPRANSQPAIYASVLEDAVRKELAINYYFHFPRSNWAEHGGLNTHEGDWEGMTLFLKQQGSAWLPDKIAIAQHVEIAGGLFGNQSDGGDLVPWTDVSRDGARPNLFVGLGGHATYAGPGVTDWGFAGDEIHLNTGEVYTPIGAQVHYLPRVADSGLPTALDWLRYPGRWGNPDLDQNPNPLAGEAGPRGPAFQDLTTLSLSELGQRWLEPWLWSKDFSPIQAPVAVDDVYAVTRNTPLSISQASGVLKNDFDSDGDQFTARLVLGPSHAISLTLNADGSFTYVPVDGYVGLDSFTYRANDNGLDSKTTTVHISVVDPAPLTIITHGFVFTPPDWVVDMAEAINGRLPAGQQCDVSLDADSDGLPDLIENSQFHVGETADSRGHPQFVLMNWDSSIPDFIPRLLAVRSLTDWVTNRISERFDAGLGPVNLHFIGHSRGTVINSEVLKRLGPLDSRIGSVQVTTLDPHPWSLANDPDPVAPDPLLGLDIWSDNYFQELAYPTGQGILGVLNVDLTAVVRAWDSGGLNHSEVHDWYHWTIDPKNYPNSDPNPLRYPGVDKYSGVPDVGANARAGTLYHNPDRLDLDRSAQPDDWQATSINGPHVGFYWSLTGGGSGERPSPLPGVTRVEGPAPLDSSPRNVPVDSVDVVFSNLIDLSTFDPVDKRDAVLTRNGQELFLNPAVYAEQVSGTTYRIRGLSGDTSADGTYTLRITATGITDRGGNPGVGFKEITWVVDTTPPTVQTVVINGALGSGTQRSMINSLRVGFSEVIALDDQAFELVNTTTDAAVNLVVTRHISGIVYDLTFAGSEIVAGSLADGSYELRIKSSRVNDLAGNFLDGDNNGVAGGDHVFGDDAIDNFFRLFGDGNGDGIVDQADKDMFKSTYGLRQGDAGFLWFFDYDGNGLIDKGDEAQFKLGKKADKRKP